jgi:hypothetical protein
LVVDGEIVVVDAEVPVVEAARTKKKNGPHHLSSIFTSLTAAITGFPLLSWVVS